MYLPYLSLENVHMTIILLTQHIHTFHPLQSEFFTSQRTSSDKTKLYKTRVLKKATICNEQYILSYSQP